MTRTHFDLLNRAQGTLGAVRAGSPLVQCLTNSVTTNFVANTLLAVGAAPAMVDIPEEAGAFTTAASAVLINLGTPTAEQRAAMLEAAVAAGKVGTPWVLDPVGVGALPVRTSFAKRLLTLKPNVIRGNASEIRALAGQGSGGQGVDSVDATEDALEAAFVLAQSTGGVVAVSGPIDLVTDGDSVIRIANGHPLLTRVTGAGCALGAVVAAFIASGDDPLATTAAACAVYAIAGELAAEVSAQPGSFAVSLLDALSSINDQDITNLGRVA